MKHDAALRALMGESKAQQKQRLQERLEQLRKLKQQGGEVDEGQMAALEQVEAEGVDAVNAEVLNQLIEETITDTEEVTTNTLLNDLSVRQTFSSFASAFPHPHSSPYHILFHPTSLCSLSLSLSLFPMSRFHISIPPFSSSPFSPLSSFSFPLFRFPLSFFFIFLYSSPRFLVAIFPSLLFTLSLFPFSSSPFLPSPSPFPSILLPYSSFVTPAPNLIIFSKSSLTMITLFSLSVPI